MYSRQKVVQFLSAYYMLNILTQQVPTDFFFGISLFFISYN